MNIKRAFRKQKNKISWNTFLSIFRLLPKLVGYPIIGPYFKRLIKLDPSERTQTYVLNLNEDLTDQAQNVILPIDMMKQAVTQASYRVIIKECLCRTAYNCQNFPHDHGCIFLGEASRAIVDKRMGKEVSLEQY